MIDITKLQKRGAKDSNDPTHNITWDTVLKFGVEDNDFNKNRYQNGEVLDLLAEGIEMTEAKEASETTGREQTDTTSINKDFIREQQELKCHYCSRSFKTISGLENHISNKHKEIL